MSRFLGYFAVVAIALAMHQPVGAQTNADFDGDGTVGFSDFLPFAGQYGAQRGDGRYQAKYDLNSDGAIDFSDFLLFASSYGSTVPPSGGDSEIVEIPDPNLRAVISDSLNKARGEPITRADMETLTSLRARERNINNLTGLEFATNLESLRLDFNQQLSDITALAGLTKLTRLDLRYNQISDIAVLSGLTNLEWLDLVGNQISDITALSGLTNLTWLHLSNNQISDITALAVLTKLTRLSLNDNQIADITALLRLPTLRSLNLRNNPLSVTSRNTHIRDLRARGVSVHF